MMSDELKIKKETIRWTSVKINGRGRLTDEQTQRRLTSRQGSIKTCQKTIPIFLIAFFFFPKVKNTLKGKKFQDV
jgi:hypothetical protein